MIKIKPLAIVIIFLALCVIASVIRCSSNYFPIEKRVFKYPMGKIISVKADKYGDSYAIITEKGWISFSGLGADNPKLVEIGKQSYKIHRVDYDAKGNLWKNRGIYFTWDGAHKEYYVGKL